MMDAQELELFTSSVRKAVQDSTGSALDATLAELGWSEALQVAPAAAKAALFLSQGEQLATSGAVHLALAHGLGLDPTALAPVLLPAAGSAAPPGRIVDGRLVVDGLLAGSLVGAQELVVVATGDGGEVSASIAIAALTLTPVAGIDAAAGLVRVSGELAAAAGPMQSRWSDAIAGAQVALAYELVGSGSAMLALAREHALSREQFGTTISSFQAVRHRLAEVHVALESAQTLAEAADEDGDAVAAAIAKAVAGRAARTATRHCQQVLAGIGFTTEHRFHLYLRRALLLDQLLGSSEVLTRELGASLLASGELPTLFAL